LVVLSSKHDEANSLIDYLRGKDSLISLSVARVFQVDASSDGNVVDDKNIEKLIDFVRGNSVDYLLLALSEADKKGLATRLDRLQELSITILEAPIDGRLDLYREEKVCEWVLFEGVPFRRLFVQPLSSRGWLLKEMEDFVLGSICFIIFSPVMVLIALAIKLNSPGPVFFMQSRHGFNGKEISVYKFRSMFHDRGEEPKVPQATKNDPRITSVGKILRRTSLDEIPQLINVLKGEMSLVGPRPHAIKHNQIYENKVADYLSRHRVKPGITGWAQVNGWRGETDSNEKMAERVRHDLYYINHWSLTFDIRILFMTLFVGFVNKNAY